MENDIESRIAAQLRRQEDRQLGAELREEAREALHCGLCGVAKVLSPEHFTSWNQLLDDEENDSVPGISAGAAALAMLEVQKNYRRQS